MPTQSLRLLAPDFWLGFWREITGSALHSMLRAVGVVVAYLVARALVNQLIGGILARLVAREVRGGVAEHISRAQTLAGLSRSLLAYLLFFVFGVQFLEALGLNVLPIITTAGVLGLAVGFGAQKLVKDMISGFFLIMDNQFVVGETVTIGTVTGVVQDIGLRVTRLLDTTGRLYIFPNGDIGLVANLSRHPVLDHVEVSIAGGADLSAAIRTIDELGKALADDKDRKLLGAPHVEGVAAFTAAAITLRVSVAADPRYLAEEELAVRTAIRSALLSANIAPA